MAWKPSTGALWTLVNERDELGSDLVPDHLTSVSDGGFYGWPFTYFGQHVDNRRCVPDYAIDAPTASLGLAWSAGNSLPSVFARGMFIGQHGSWNRRPFSGYKVILVPFNADAGKPSGAPIDVLTGFLSDQGQAYGRQVGVAIDKSPTMWAT